MEENSQNHDINEETEPQVTSIDPNERKLARRLRIQRRAEALRRQQMQVGQEIVEEVEKTQVEQQVETSNKDLQTLVSEGLELVTNVRIANDAREVKRREENVVAHQERMAKLDQELVAGAQKLEEINARWKGILETNDPLDLYHDIHHQRVKCSELMSQKDQLIQELRKELHLADDRFMRDQRRQKQDLGLLCERIDQQVVVMGRAYKQELLLIEDAISRERRQLIEAGKRKWEGLYKARDKLELSHMDKKMHTVQQFEQEIYKIHKENEEHYRAKKLQLETDLQVLQQELEQVKALCLLNMEKLDYNYQVLKKRDEENIIMKSQQKRRINKLQDIVNGLRRRIVETERSSSQETTRLTEEVGRLHRNIVDIENKAGHFTQVNDSKYNQLWQLNTDTARALLDKILSADRVIHEQLLGLDWYQPGQPLLQKTDLASYRSAMQVVAELFKDKVNQKAVNSPGAHTVQFQGEAGLLRQILQKIADNSGFLVEERLKELLAPYSERERTLIRIDNVFSALNVHSGKDMDLLMTSFLPYCYCSMCDLQDQIALTETEITTYDNSLSRESSEMCVEHMDSGSNTTAATAPVANITTSLHYSENTRAISSQRTIGAKDLCRAANHPLSIEHAYVLKALKDFAAKFYETRFGISLASSLDRKHSTVSRLLTDEDVFMYWSRFLELFDTRHEKLWDGLYLGLKKYQEVLEDRHKLNQQTELLKVQNCELRRLLHTYMMTGSKKTQKPDREFVPPHARRRMVTHMLLFDEP